MIYCGGLRDTKRPSRCESAEEPRPQRELGYDPELGTNRIWNNNVK